MAASTLRYTGATKDHQGVSGGPRLIGLGLSGWYEDGGVQQDLFGTTAPLAAAPGDRLDDTLDAIRRKVGKGYPQRGLNRRR